MQRHRVMSGLGVCREQGPSWEDLMGEGLVPPPCKCQAGDQSLGCRQGRSPVSLGSVYQLG